MYTSFAIENFRCFEDLTVQPLARVNLIAGQNNVGKTALLEALWLFSHPTEPRNALQTILRELADYGQGEFFADLFPQYQTGLTIKLQAENIQSRRFRTLCIRRKYRAQQPLFDWSKDPETELDDDAIADFDFSNELAFEYVDETGKEVLTSAWLNAEPGVGWLRPMLRDSRTSMAPPEYPCVFDHPRTRYNARALATRFGRAERERYSSAIEKAIRLLEPRLKRMTTIADSHGRPSLHGDIGTGRLFPMAIMGEGTKRLLALSLAFLSARDGIILIDEIENGLHHSVLVDVWKNLDWLSREFNVQVFATTHSYECIVAANNAFTEIESDDLHFHRLNRKGEQVRAVTYTKAMLATNIEYFWELR